MQTMELRLLRPGEVVAPGHGLRRFQELATRLSHRNTALPPTRSPTGSWRASLPDENLHMLFYRDIVSEAIQLDPSAVVKAIAAVVETFEMPGVGIAGYRRKAAQIAMAGIYDLRIHHDEVVWPLLRHWNVFDLEGLDAEAEQARERLRPARHARRQRVPLRGPARGAGRAGGASRTARADRARRCPPDRLSGSP